MLKRFLVFIRVVSCSLLLGVSSDLSTTLENTPVSFNDNSALSTKVPNPGQRVSTVSSGHGCKLFPVNEILVLLVIGANAWECW